MIKVLVVEDSPVDQELLVHILRSDPEIEVVGVANNGEKAFLAAELLKPDLITMDICMPGRDGYETTRRIMENQPVPIIIVSGNVSPSDTDQTFKAMEAGALAALKKPHGPGHSNYSADCKDLIRLVKTMSEVKVVRRWPKKVATVSPGMTPHASAKKDLPEEIKLIAIGASTGGPAVYREILSALPKQFNTPIVAVQHMSKGFMCGFVEWLTQTTGIPVHLATDGGTIQPGQVYFAPDDKHLLIGRGNRIQLCGTALENGLRPAVAALFRSVADNYAPHAAAVLLTGMGKDGAAELKILKQKGVVTLIQDRETSVVFGMPGEASALGAADYILSPRQIAGFLSQLITQHRDGSGSLPGRA